MTQLTVINNSEDAMSAVRNEMTDESIDTVESAPRDTDRDFELAGYPPPAPEDRARVADQAMAYSTAKPPMIWAVSAHGGAGAGALASRIGFIADAGTTFPSGEYPGENLIVICAEETLSGLIAAHNLILQHLNGLGGDTRLLGLVTRPARPGWEGKKLPKEIRTHLGLLSDPHLVDQIIRLGWDDTLAVTLPEDRESLSPADVVEWLGMDDKAQTKAAKNKRSLAGRGVTQAAATLLAAAAESSAPSTTTATDTSEDTEQEDN
jgi:hypothetical protein